MPLPAPLEALLQPPPPTLDAVPCRLDPVTLARLDSLQSQLGCKRGPLVRALVQAGLDVVESQRRGEVVIHD